LGSNTFYNIVLGLVMLGGRYLPMIPSLALAGAMAAKPLRPMTPGTFRTDSVLFMLLLVGVALIDSALIFLPANTLGPILRTVSLGGGKDVLRRANESSVGRVSALVIKRWISPGALVNVEDAGIPEASIQQMVF
jgi:hypothetical protein